MEWRPGTISQQDFQNSIPSSWLIKVLHFNKIQTAIINVTSRKHRGTQQYGALLGTGHGSYAIPWSWTPSKLEGASSPWFQGKYANLETNILPTFKEKKELIFPTHRETSTC